MPITHKYLLAYAHATLALKYNSVRNTVSIGGNAVFAETLAHIVHEYFAQPTATPVRVQRNKLRYDFACDNFASVINALCEAGAVVSACTTHGSMMR